MTHPRDEVRAIVRSMRLLVAGEREAGVAELPGIAAPPVPAAPPPQAPPHPARAAPAREAAYRPRVAALDLPADALAPFGDLPARVAACTKCVLCDSRT